METNDKKPNGRKGRLEKRHNLGQTKESIIAQFTSSKNDRKDGMHRYKENEIETKTFEKPILLQLMVMKTD